MKIGLAAFLTDRGLDPVRLAREVEARGFSSLWYSEHTHLPVDDATPPGAGSGVPHEDYRRTLDPFIAAAMGMAVTSTLRFGTGVALVAQHDPIVLAKKVATLDHGSTGRFELGVGFGWNRTEMADHGVDYDSRRERVADHIGAIRALWAEEPTGYEGRWAKVTPSYAWPKPAGGGVPIVVGGSAGPKMFHHIAAWADGWLPIGGSGIRAALPQLHEAWAAAGREGAPTVVPFGVIAERSKLDYFAGLGITEVTVRMPGSGADEMLRTLDELAAFVD